MAIEQVRSLINDCNRIVVLSGSKVMFESGLKGVRQEEYAYDVESKYGYSPEEIVTAEFLNRRSDLFYRYYREDILDMEKLRPNEAHYAMAELEKRGKLLSVITRSVYGLHNMAGVTRIIELHGSIHRNYCKKCGRVYGPQYIADSRDIPRCEHCRIMLTPGIALYGSAIDNGMITRCADVVSNADMLMIVGASTRSNLTSYLLRYYNGKNLVTINDGPGEGDETADYTLYGSCCSIMPQLMGWR